MKQLDSLEFSISKLRKKHKIVSWPTTYDGIKNAASKPQINRAYGCSCGCIDYKEYYKSFPSTVPVDSRICTREIAESLHELHLFEIARNLDARGFVARCIQRHTKESA